MKDNFDHLSKYRIRKGFMGSDDSIGRRGAFQFPSLNGLVMFIAIADCGNGPLVEGWEHVSVRARTKGAKEDRCPTWEEMCFVKRLFWKDDETVIQYHPPEENYINDHSAVLHLWRPIQAAIPMPPEILV
jgi:hypothetical protein